MRDAALGYVAAGIPVFPLRPRGKEPLTPHGFHDASTDVEQIRRWWKRWPSANIGVPTGAASGWDVLDFDPRNNGDPNGVIPERPALPATRAARTGSGGLHRVYQHHDGLTSKGALYMGVDLKADGGYIVVAPSVHPCGERYAWLNQDELLPLPRWVIEDRAKLSPQEETDWREVYTGPAPQGRQEDAQKWIANALTKAATEGSRNRAGFWLACQLLWNGIPDPEAAMFEYADAVPEKSGDPYTRREAWRSLASAARYPRREPARSQSRTLRPEPSVASTAPAATLAAETDESAVDTALIAFEADDDGNARAALHLFPNTFLYSPAFGWLMWSSTHWRRVPEGVVGQVVIQVLKRRRIAGVRANSSKGEAIIKVCKADKQRVAGALQLLQIHVIEPEVDVFDANPDVLNCLNGVLDLRTGLLTPHDRSQRFTYCVPADYDPSADTSQWLTFVQEATGQNADVATYLQNCAGYSLTGHTREEKMFYLYGPPRAGKGTFTETLLALLPDPLSTEVDFVSFTARRESDSQNFDLAELKPARVVFASESNRYQSLNPAKIKQVTGGNRIRCAFKHKDMFTYKPQFKVWLVSNHQVNADADDDALWGRVQVIVFPHSHLGMEDLTLKESMRANLSGVLRWCVEGAQRWYAQGRLTPPAAVVEATQEHRSTQDYIGHWLSECCTVGVDDWTPSSTLMDSYKGWCETNGIKPLRFNDVAETLQKRFGCTYKRQTGGTRGYLGITMGVSEVVTPEARVTASDTSLGENPYAREYGEKTPNQPSSGVTSPSGVTTSKNEPFPCSDPEEHRQRGAWRLHRKSRREVCALCYPLAWKEVK